LPGIINQYSEKSPLALLAFLARNIFPYPQISRKNLKIGIRGQINVFSVLKPGK
jgi:hypothetical protein